MDVNRARPVGRYGAGDSGAAGAGGEGDAPYIWLRYSTQFTTGGRTHTIEMEVPVPVGASAELREQLIREAEANMEHLYRRVEARARGQRPAESAQRSGAAQPSVQQAPQPSHQPQPSQPVQPVRPVQRLQPLPSAPGASPQPAPTSTSSRAGTDEGPQAISLHDRRAGAGASPGAPAGPAAAQPSQTQARPTNPGELPVTPGLASAGSGTMKLSEFIQIIRDNWGLSAKQAMDLLQVKSLNNMNYRDLLRQLEPLVEQAPPSTSSATSSSGSSSRSATPAGPSSSPASSGPARPPIPPMPTSSAPASSPSIARTPLPAAPQRETGQPARPGAPQSTNAAQQAGTAQRSPAPPPTPPSRASTSSSQPSQPPQMEGPANIPVYPLREDRVRESARVYKFDEEDEEQEDLEGEDAGGDTATKEEGSMSEAMARIKIDELRDMRGTTGANPGRLVVLHNLLDSQISDEQFLHLIEGLWNTVSDKKLKQDQVEALISWAKEDYFEDEVRAVLAVLNE